MCGLRSFRLIPFAVAAAKRAVRDFTVSGDLWPTVDSWALRQGYRYRMVGESEDHRLYRKDGVAGLRLLDLHETNGQVHMEAWVAVDLYLLWLRVLILPSGTPGITEITIESCGLGAVVTPGGIRAVVTRMLGRREVNDLLGALGQPPID